MIDNPQWKHENGIFTRTVHNPENGITTTWKKDPQTQTMWRYDSDPKTNIIRSVFEKPVGDGLVHKAFYLHTSEGNIEKKVTMRERMNLEAIPLSIPILILTYHGEDDVTTVYQSTYSQAGEWKVVNITTEQSANANDVLGMSRAVRVSYFDRQTIDSNIRLVENIYQAVKSELISREDTPEEAIQLLESIVEQDGMENGLSREELEGLSLLSLKYVRGAFTHVIPDIADRFTESELTTLFQIISLELTRGIAVDFKPGQMSNIEGTFFKTFRYSLSWLLEKYYNDLSQLGKTRVFYSKNDDINYPYTVKIKDEFDDELDSLAVSDGMEYRYGRKASSIKETANGNMVIETYDIFNPDKTCIQVVFPKKIAVKTIQENITSEDTGWEDAFDFNQLTVSHL